jgi:hypothetical protein
MAHWIENEARRANRNLLITNLVLLACAGLMFILDRDIDYRSDFVLIGFGVAVILVAGWNCFKALRRYSEIETCPLWRQAAIHGDVEQLAVQIEQDQQMGQTKYGRLVITPSWLIHRSLFLTWVSPLEDLAWVYKKTITHYTNFIPTGKSYAAVIAGRHRQQVEVRTSKKKVEKLLADLATRVPWVIFGYSKEIQNAWQKDAPGFVAAVDSRRQAFTAKGGSAGS